MFIKAVVLSEKKDIKQIGNTMTAIEKNVYIWKKDWKEKHSKTLAVVVFEG